MLKTSLIAALSIPLGSLAQEGDIRVPNELLPFVEKDSRPIAVRYADLNQDGLGDYLLVFEREHPAKDTYDIPTRQRPMLIITRQADGSLKEIKRNERVILCSTCGGMMGDPFVEITTKGNTFTINHYGGTGWRWGSDATFGYSRIDQTWQLTQMVTSRFHASDPDHIKINTFKPPRDFGKIDFADFDPKNYLTRDKKRAP